MKSDATRNRGIFVKDDILTFKATPKGETSDMQFRLCNDTMELQKVRFYFTDFNGARSRNVNKVPSKRQFCCILIRHIIEIFRCFSHNKGSILKMDS